MTDDKELKQAIAELQEVVRCRCDEAYRDRGLKDPHCECDSAEAVKIVADHIKALTVESARRLALARSEGVARVEQFERNEALTEQLAAARKDAEEAEAYARELEAKLERAVEEAEKYQYAFAAQSRKLQSVLHIDGVRTTLAELTGCKDE